SLPTFSMAWAMISPIEASELAEMVPTWAMALESVQGLASFFSSPTMAAVALSMPRLRSIGFMPAATAFRPSLTMAWASTVAVVVPSPAASLALDATSLTSWAPMFSNLSFSSISLATDTPSLVISGAPKLRSSTTLRPFGPRVALTASARTLTPTSIFLRAESPNLTSLAAILLVPQFCTLGRRCVGSGFDDGEDFVLAHHQQVFAVDLDGVAAAVRAEHHLVTDLDGQRANFAVVQDFAGTDGDDFTLVRLLGGRARQHDAASGFGLFFAATDDDAVMQRTKLHCRSLLIVVSLAGECAGGLGKTGLGPGAARQWRAAEVCSTSGGNLAVKAR